LRYIFTFILSLATFACVSQVDTNYLKALYDHSIDLDESKKDSVKYYSEFIAKHAARLDFEKGDVLTLRLNGYYAELSNFYEEALSFYLQALAEARRIKAVEYEISALSDLAIVYTAVKEPHEAKKFYQQAAELVRQRGELGSVIGTYINLGVIFTQLEMYDSAMYVLNEALRLGKPVEAKIDLSSLYNNLGNVYFKRKQYEQALQFFRDNYNQHQDEGNLSGFWADNLNMADVFVEQKRYDSALLYASKALRLSTQLESKSKEADSYALLAKLSEARGDYKLAHEYLRKWYSLDTAIVNSDTYRTIAELQEKFNARDREVQNKLLQFEIDKQRIWSRGLTVLVMAFALTGVLAFVAFITKRNANKRLSSTNEMITRQNQKLAELNYEKNSLIGIVSHDLSTPFATIQLWGQVLQSANGKLDGEQQKAVSRIIQASKYGDNLINRILDIEKTDIVNHRVQLKMFDLVAMSKEVIENFIPQATNKGIELHTEFSTKEIFILSDEQLVQRICSNLVSNAIKYTPREKHVWFSAREEGDSVVISVSDEGVGIDESDLPHLFSKYSKISSQPTDGEHSTGLGLSIVKRIVEELNGQISCESEPGKGSVFAVTLKK
jgi:signal transduction histidine kinase